MSADHLSSAGGLFLKSETVETNRLTGATTTRVFAGTKSQLIARRNMEINFGASVTKLEFSEGAYTLTSSFNFDAGGGQQNAATPPTNAHELEIDVQSVDIFTSEIMRKQLYDSFGSWAGVNGAITFLKGKVDQWDGQDNHAAADITTIEDTFNIYAGAQLALMLNLFRGIAYHQIRNTPQFNPIYRRRITAATCNQVRAAFAGVGEVWTASEISSFEGVPSLWWFQLPDKVWFKYPPTVNSIAGQKTEIVYQYVASAYAWSGNNIAYNAAPLISF